MKKKAKPEFVQRRRSKGGWTLTSSIGMRWDQQGRCFKQVDDGPETRCPDNDFGTPMGDLLIDPWMQDILKDG